MLKLNSVFVNESMIDVVLATQHELGIFKDVIHGKNIMVTCPFHKGGMENNPSMGIATEELTGIETGYCACFTCSWRGSFSRLIEEVVGLEEGEGESWLLARYSPYFATVKELPLLHRKEAMKQQAFLDPHFLDGFDTYHPYIQKRGITRETADLFMLRYNPYEDSIIFPVRDVQGRIRYLTDRKIGSKIFKLPKGINKGLYGVYEARLRSTSNEILVVESAFNAMSATQWGRPAVALFGTGTKDQMDAIKQLPYAKVVLAFDGDEAGKTATNKFIKALTGKKFISVLEVPEGKDINDLTRNEFLNLPEY